MVISTNAQRVVRIYRGSTKVWEDPHLGEWQDIIWQEKNGKAQVTNKFMAVNGIIIFDGSVENGLDGNASVTIPSRFQGLKLLTYPRVIDSNGNYYSISLYGNVLTVSNQWAIMTNEIMLSYTK